jgi:hypothetical protein
MILCFKYPIAFGLRGVGILHSPDEYKDLPLEYCAARYTKAIWAICLHVAVRSRVRVRSNMYYFAARGRGDWLSRTLLTEGVSAAFFPKEEADECVVCLWPLVLQGWSRTTMGAFSRLGRISAPVAQRDKRPYALWTGHGPYLIHRLAACVAFAQT